MITAKNLIVAALLLFQVSLFAQTARIDVVSPDKKTGMVFQDAYEGVGVAQAGWLGDIDKDKRIVAETPVVPGEWRECFFAFTPKASGQLQIELMGEKGKWVEYAALSVEGASLKNGDFSKLDAKGVPEGWNASGEAAVRKYGDSVCVRANHDNRMSQKIQAEAGKTITISFKARQQD